MIIELVVSKNIIKVPQNDVFNILPVFPKISWMIQTKMKIIKLKMHMPEYVLFGFLVIGMDNSSYFSKFLTKSLLNKLRFLPH